MDDYTPDMEDMFNAYQHVAGNSEGWFLVNMNPPAASELRAQFDRFIEQVRGAAWDEGCEHGGRYGHSDGWYIDRDFPDLTTWPYDDNPYRRESKRDTK